MERVHYYPLGCLAVLSGGQTVAVGVAKARSEEAAVAGKVTEPARQASGLHKHHP